MLNVKVGLMNIFTRTISLTVMLIIYCGCTQQSTKVFLNEHSDLSNKFKVGIPHDWHIEKIKTEMSSTIFFSDTTKSVNDVIIYELTWDSLTIYLINHFRISMDSICKLYDQKPSNQELKQVKDFQYYHFDVEGIDTINNLHFTTTYRYIKSPSIKGHVKFSIRKHKSSLTRNDSILFNQIWNSIKI